MVGSDGAIALPWLEPVLRRAVGSRAHALLLHGPAGVGEFELALSIAQAWLCEAAEPAAAPCGRCASCRLVQAHSHPDLLVLIPPALRESIGWGSSDEDTEAVTERAAKGKPSKDIKVEAIRAAVAFSQTSSARGRGKVVALHPAERMNGIAANAFLKTLEEPPGATRFVLSCTAPDALLPTIRSRCQSVAIGLPERTEAARWLAEQGVGDPDVMLAAAGGQPQEALAWSQLGVDAAQWRQLPRLIEQGTAAPFAAWPLARVVDMLHRVCHDAMCAASGAAPRFFPVASVVGGGAELGALAAWQRELVRTARHVEHPWNAGLTIESLVQQGRSALRARVPMGPQSRGDSLHLRG